MTNFLFTFCMANVLQDKCKQASALAALQIFFCSSACFSGSLVLVDFRVEEDHVDPEIKPPFFVQSQDRVAPVQEGVHVVVDPGVPVIDSE